MTTDQIILFCLLFGVFALLLWGRIRYDVVAFSALVIALLTGVVPKEEAFTGFGHPATVVIALVLIVSRALSNAGAIELLARYVVDASRSLAAHIGIMSGVAAVLSGIMNNVAALALLMPIDIQAAHKAKRNVALSLMPLSFATILGGMITLIGTPPNIVVAAIRDERLGAPFSMFDFTPVGGAVAVAGILFVALLGWRLIPNRDAALTQPTTVADLEAYLAEAVVPNENEAIGKRLRDLYAAADGDDVSIVGLVRDGRRMPGSARNLRLRAGDHLVLEGGPAGIEQFIGAHGLRFPDVGGSEARRPTLSGESHILSEVVVPEGAQVIGHSARDLHLAYRHGVMLLGVSRRGQRFRERVRKLPIMAGDILLLYGPEERLPAVIAWMDCVPLAERGLNLLQRENAWPAIGIFLVAIVLASLGLVYLPIALAGAVALFALLGIVRPSRMYSAVEWPVIVLLGSLIPIGGALESSGGTRLLAEQMLHWTEGYSPVVLLTLLMIITMTLSDILNNVATTLIAAPVGVDIASKLGVSPDPFLMAVAVAASCAFLTPIGHKNNTI
ncbi:MAG: SLC13 family permease, partial [Gammaproteobacteria bacterium]|nr:SLC13 family permease [Gammaproteobacteria bacterium]